MGASESTMSMFERLAAREERKERTSAARGAGGGKARGAAKRYGMPGGGYNSEEHSAQTASPILRFVQVAGLFYVVFWLGTKFAGPGHGAGVRAEELHDANEEWQDEDAAMACSGSRRRARRAGTVLDAQDSDGDDVSEEINQHRLTISRPNTI